jgi:hypothetical protein
LNTVFHLSGHYLPKFFGTADGLVEGGITSSFNLGILRMKGFPRLPFHARMSYRYTRGLATKTDLHQPALAIHCREADMKLVPSVEITGYIGELSSNASVANVGIHLRLDYYWESNW